MKVALDGGAPVVICNAANARGRSVEPLRNDRVPGEPPRQRSGAGLRKRRARRTGHAADVTGPDVSHRWPVFLPDGVHFLYLVVSTDDERRGVYLASTAAKMPDEPTRLFRSSSGPVYVPLPESSSGILLSTEGRWVEARPFDTTRLAVTGDARRIDVTAVGASPHHAALLGASSDILAFAAAPIPYGTHVATVMSNGDDFEIWPERELGGFLRLSPDGGRLARARHIQSAATQISGWTT